MTATTQRPLPPDAIAGLSSIAEACDVLRAWGNPDLADRLAYLASDEDLEEGDLPATLESARGFLAFFGPVASSDASRVEMSTMPDGWISAHWYFADERTVSVYFIDHERALYSACKSDGSYVDRDRKDGHFNQSDVAVRLVGMKQWFTWFKERPDVARSRTRIT